MIPTVVVILTVLSPTLTLPIAIQDAVTTGIGGAPQIQEGVSLPQQVQKFGVQSSFEVNTQAQINQVEKSTFHSGTPEQYTEVNSAQQVTKTERTGAEVPFSAFVSPQNAAVPTVGSVPVHVEPAQTSYTENPVFLPVQPLSVVPATQVDQVLQLVVVPAEIIPAEKMIVMATDSFQQRNFQKDVSNVPGSQISYQQVVQPVTYTQPLTQAVKPNQQPNYVISVGEPDQGYSPVGAQPNLNQFVKKQTVPVMQTAQQSVAETSNYNQTPVEPNAQVFSIGYNKQPIITEDFKKQTSTGYSSVQTQLVEPSVQQQQQQHHVQQSVEKQVPHQQISIQNQDNFVKQTGFENIVKQVPNQQYNDVQTQNVETNYQQEDCNAQHTVKTQVPYQQVNSYTPVQNQPVESSVFNAQPTVVIKTEKIGQHYEAYSPIHIQSVEPQQQQIQDAQQVVKNQVPYQQPVAVQTHPVKSINEQPVFSAKPIHQVENKVQYQKESQFQNTEHFSEKAPENFEFQPNQQFLSVQPQEVTSYVGEHNHSVKDEALKVQQNVPIHTFTSVPQTQDYSLQPSVGSV